MTFLLNLRCNRYILCDIFVFDLYMQQANLWKQKLESSMEKLKKQKKKKGKQRKTEPKRPLILLSKK